MQSIYLGLNAIAKYNLFEALRSVLFAAFLFIFLVLFRWQLKGAITSWILVGLLMGSFPLLYLKKIIQERLNYNFAALKNSLTFGLKNHVGVIGSFLNYRIDVFLVGYFTDNAQLGLYAISVGLGEMFWYIPSSVQLVLTPHIASSKSSKISEVTIRYERNLCLLMLILIILFVQIDKLLIRVAFGEAFLPAYLPLRYLLPGIFTLSLSKILSADFIGRGKPEVTTLASSISLIINVGLNLVLIPIYGISGAAMASSVSYSAQTAILTFIFIKTTGYHLKDLFIIAKKDIELYKEIYPKRQLTNH